MKHRNLEILREHYINVPDFIVVDGKEELDLSFSKEELFEKIWGYESDAEYNNVEVYISFLRKKLTHIESTVSIKTVRGVGYCLESKQH